VNITQKLIKGMTLCKLKTFVFLTALIFISGAAIVNVATSIVQTQIYLPDGIFFAIAGLAQAGLVVVLVTRPSKRVYLGGAILNLALVSLTVASKALGLPINHSGQPAGLGISDINSGVLEVITAFNLFLLLNKSDDINQVAFHKWRIVISILVTFILTLSGIAGAFSIAPIATNASSAGDTSVTSLTEKPGNQPIKSFTLTAEVKNINGHEQWAYNGIVPGPQLKVTQGDMVKVTLINHLPVGTTIHWHGVDLPNAADGVAGVTQDATSPGSTYTYEFVAKDVGTYWYHSHQETDDQVLKGLFGSLIVEPKAGPVADKDYSVILHESPGDNAISKNGLSGYANLAKSEKAAFNGSTGDTHFDAKPGEHVRLRLITAIQGEPEGVPGYMIANPREVSLVGTSYKITALDGHDLNEPQTVESERVQLAIGQRYDFSFTMPANGSVRLIDTRGVETVTIGNGKTPDVSDISKMPIFDLTNYGKPAPDATNPSNHFDITYPMTLDFKSGLKDNQPQLRQTINSQTAPVGEMYMVKDGQEVRFQVNNKTPEFHSIHLHGHYFTILSHNGQPIKGSPIHLDSLLVAPNDKWDIAFQANNPGLWMLHCHVLVHAAFGMSAMVMYTGISTPFNIGPKSGNVPE
jgi:FtsP/CotA-like multicopper oxidase with cupredoxin domain